MKISKINILILIVLSTFACKPLQKTVIQAPIKRTSQDLFLDSIRQVQPMIETAVVKLNINIDYNGRSFSSAATCKMRRDSAMHISLQPVFGVEMFKMEITPQKIRIFDKLNQRYYETDFGFIESKLGEGINFRNFQALISNNYLNMFQADTLSSVCSIDGNSLLCQNTSVKQTTTTGNNYRIQNVSLEYPASSRKMNAKYTDFNLVDGLVFPFKISLQASKPGTQVKIDFNCSKISFVNHPVFTTTDVSQYTKADIKQLMTK